MNPPTLTESDVTSGIVAYQGRPSQRKDHKGGHGEATGDYCKHRYYKPPGRYEMFPYTKLCPVQSLTHLQHWQQHVTANFLPGTAIAFGGSSLTQFSQCTEPAYKVQGGVISNMGEILGLVLRTRSYNLEREGERFQRVTFP